MNLLAALLLAAPVATPAAAVDAGLPAVASDGGSAPMPGASELVAEGADAGVYKFNDPKRRDTVRFTIDGTFLQINGVASELEGELQLKGNKASGELKLQVGSIRTGDATRDSHLRGEEWLDAKKHPYITFSFKDVELPAEQKDGAKIPLKLKGEFEIHGVKHDEPVEAIATFFKASDQTKTRHEGDLVHVQAKCKLKLDHFKLEARKKMPQEVGEQAEVSFDAWGSTKL